MKRRFFLRALAAAVASPTPVLAQAPVWQSAPIILHPGDDIQAALDRCRGGVVYLTAGVYRTRQVVVPSNFTLRAV